MGYQQQQQQPRQTNKQIRSNKVRFTAVSQTVTGNNLSVGGKL